jgi:hypothetical protein
MRVLITTSRLHVVAINSSAYVYPADMEAQVILLVPNRACALRNLSSFNGKMSAQNAELSNICTACSGITLEMLHSGFQHCLTYQQTIESGRTCRLCRLMVCTFARLQIGSNCYDVDQSYEASVQLLKQSKSVLRHALPSNARNLGVVMESMIDPPLHLAWKRHETMPELCGTFGDGATIQVSAPEGIVFCEYQHHPADSTMQIRSTCQT